MVKKLTRHGNSFALVIDRPILDLLKIDPETPLDVSTDGRQLIVAPVKVSARRRISRTPGRCRTVGRGGHDGNQRGDCWANRT
jgi:hypothetical protein